MESLTFHIPSSPSIRNLTKTHKPTSKSNFLISNSFLNPISPFNSTFKPSNSHKSHFPPTKKIPLFKENNSIRQNLSQFLPNGTLSLLCFPLFSLPLSSLASETNLSIDEASNKINLEAILVSIDDFFNRYPFFVAGVTFIWLVVIPLTEEYLQKYKFISAINGFKKLRDDPSAQLLDIRGQTSLGFLGSPNLKILNKSVVQIEFSEADEDGFVKMALEKFQDPANTIICVIDNFDGNSIKVAELLVKNGGFKEAYAIEGGIRGKNGWLAIQETLLPPSVHIFPKRRAKKSFETNGGANQQNLSSDNVELISGEKKMENGYVNRSVESKHESRSLSPYAMVEGYLSLTNAFLGRSTEEDHDDYRITEPVELNFIDTDEPIDDAIWVQRCRNDVYHYDFHVLYSSSYRVPVLYFRAYYNDGQPLMLDQIEEDLPANSAKVLSESKWTFITQEEHPYLNRPWYTLHPCGTSEWMKLLLDAKKMDGGDGGGASVAMGGRAADQYLVSWLSVVGQVFGLKIPFQMVHHTSS